MGFLFHFNEFAMKVVKVKAYAATKVILLAFDWTDGKGRNDFLGFAIKRTPGFNGKSSSWLFNRITFKNASTSPTRFQSNESPIQKFMWWDAQFEDKDLGKQYQYEVTPVVGVPGQQIKLLKSVSKKIKVTPAPAVKNGIGTYFNRAVVSSQSFSKKFVGSDNMFDAEKLPKALAWLANGFEKIIPDFLQIAAAVEGAIYHLTDKEWVLPAMKAFGKSLSMVYDDDKNDNANKEALTILGNLPNVQLLPRNKASIMHNKFLINIENNIPISVLMGSANFSTDAFSSQANLLHIFKDRKLAQLYLDRKRILEENPSLSETKKHAEWSDEIKIGSAKVRVFFSPEKEPGRIALDPVVQAIKNAKSSALFCIYTPTDKAIREALFEAGDNKKMMFGLINSISDEEPDEVIENASDEARVAVFHRSKNNRDVYDPGAFTGPNAKAGFWWELKSIPKSIKNKFPVYIHHKFIVIDGETKNPIIYTGSANFSNNSNYRNDENLIEIKNAPEVARFYMAEFFRLYEHYRARARSTKKGFALAGNSSWATKHYTSGTPEFKSRVNMVK